MKRTIAALALAAAFTASATAQQYASSDGYRVCAPSATEQGISVAAEQCGTVKAPNFSTAKITSERDLRALIDQRDTFRADVKTYGQCITQLINSYRRPRRPGR
jgi:hypothetical protein